MAYDGSASSPYPGRSAFDLSLYVRHDGTSGNSTRYAWELRAHNPSGSRRTYVLDGLPWSVTVEGQTWSGSHNLNFRDGHTYLVLAAGVSGWKAHDNNGNLRVDFSASHGGSIFGVASLSGGFNADRLPTLPKAPHVTGIDQITHQSFRYRFRSGGGATATSGQIQYSASSTFSNATTVASMGTTTISSLKGGGTYYVRSRHANSFGKGPWSASRSVTLLLPAPTLTGWSQNVNGELVATWTAPSPATKLTGYRLQVARDVAFTSGVQNINLGNVSERAVAGLAGGRVYYTRIAARGAAGVGQYSPSRNVMLVLDAGDLDGWTRVGSKPPTISSFTVQGIRRGVVGGRHALIVESLSTGAVSLPADTFGIQRTVTGLTPGTAYRFEASAILTGAPRAHVYRLRVISETSAAPVEVTGVLTSLGSIEFVADAGAVTLQILLAEAVSLPAAVDDLERVGFSTIRLLEVATDYPVRLRETVYESNLANHFDLACNSVGASWYVAKDGVTRFRLPGTALPVSTVFTDETDDDALHYIDVNAAYDTRGMVNRLDVTNYGVDDERTNEENDELVVTSDTSITAYGVRSGRLETNLWDKPPYDESLTNRLTNLLTAADAPRLFLAGFRWNAQENLAAANALELGQRILVRFNGTEQDSQIVTIQHDITPRRWVITIALQRL